MSEHRTPRGGHQRAQAQNVAVAAFEFLAADFRRLQRFLVSTGIEVTALRTASREPDFLAGVLDHLCGEEELLVAFASEHGMEPDRVVAARDALIINGRAWERDTP